jgi:hypothetical protein
MKNYLFAFFFLALVSTAAAQEIGLQLYSLRNELKTDVPGTIAKVKEWGITELEGGSTYGMTGTRSC